LKLVALAIDTTPQHATILPADQLMWGVIYTLGSAGSSCDCLGAESPSSEMQSQITDPSHVNWLPSRSSLSQCPACRRLFTLRLDLWDLG
jgi:hypothetical protein